MMRHIFGAVAIPPTNYSTMFEEKEIQRGGCREADLFNADSQHTLPSLSKNPSSSLQL